MYDIPAMIGKALEVSGQESLYYTGFSMGTLTMFAKLSTDPSFSKYVRFPKYSTFEINIIFLDQKIFCVGSSWNNKACSWRILISWTAFWKRLSGVRE